MCKPDEYLSLQDAASMLPGVTTTSLRRWAHAGKLPFIKMPNGRLWFKPEDVRAFLEPVQLSADGVG